MGPWGPDMPVRPDVSYGSDDQPWDYHCSAFCCDQSDLCRCECSWCDCRYADRQGS